MAPKPTPLTASSTIGTWLQDPKGGPRSPRKRTRDPAQRHLSLLTVTFDENAG
jgi:hypothetical protein